MNNRNEIFRILKKTVKRVKNGSEAGVLKFKAVVWLLLFLFVPFLIFPCTTVIVSGQATPDGRPLFWKHRVLNSEQNIIRFFAEGRYKYLAVVNAADSLGKEVWVGVNETGFAIRNSASYNLKPETDTSNCRSRRRIDEEGSLGFVLL